MLNELKITLGQSNHQGDFNQWVDKNKRNRIANPQTQLNSLFRAVDTAKRDEAQFIVLPELFLPREFLNKNIRAICEENHFVIIGGLEYGPIWAGDSDKITPLENEAFIAIPSQLQKSTEASSHHCTIMTLPKILPAEEEDLSLKSNGYSFRKGNKIYIFKSSLLGDWAVLICSDFLNLPIHVMLQASIQTLFVIAYNTDVNGYSSIADTMQRLLMCNVIVCNIGKYGSSLSYSPFRKDYKRQVLRITGNEIDVAVTIKVPLETISQAQRGTPLQDSDSQQLFIKRPPGYGEFEIIRSRE
jgi:hypothetical protein